MRLHLLGLAFLLSLLSGPCQAQAPKDSKQAVSRYDVALGMTTKQVIFAWGKPTRTEVRVSESGRREIFTYKNTRKIDGKVVRGEKYLWFTNDKLTSFSFSPEKR